MLSWPYWFLQFRVNNPSVSQADAYTLWQHGAAPTTVSATATQPPSSLATIADQLYKNGGLVSTPEDTQDYAAGIGRNFSQTPAQATASNTSGSSIPEGEAQAQTGSTFDWNTGTVVPSQNLGYVTPFAGAEQGANTGFGSALTEGTGGLILALAAAGALGAGGAGAETAPAATSDATLQSVLDSASVPSAANGVQVAGPAEAAASSIPAPSVTGSVLSDFAAPASVDAINAATPGTISMGVPASDVAGSALASPGVTAAAGAAGGSLLTNAAATGAGTAATGAAINGASGSDPAPAPAPSAPQDIQMGPNTPTSTGGGYQVDPNTGNVTGTAAGGAATGAAGTALSRILGGNASTADWLSVLGGGAATGLGIYGANEQANKLKEIADRYYATGAPSRQRYEASFAPGFKATDMPGYQDALDTSTDTLLRRASTGGNPVGNPGVMAEIAKYVTGNVALPALQQYRTQNANTGGYSSFNTAAPSAATGAVGAGSNVYNAIGSGIADVTNPRMTLADLARSLNMGGLT